MKTAHRRYCHVLLASLIVLGCESSTDLAPTRNVPKPVGIFGRAVNTPGDEFAAGYESTDRDSFLMFTSNMGGKESVYRVPLPKITSDDSVRSMRAPYHEMPTALARNTGTVTSNNHTTVFAISSAIQKELARILKTSGAVVGGSDLFERAGDGETRNVEELNSSSWEAQPTLSLRKGVEVIVFSSDRMAKDGFSAPYDGVEYRRADGSTLKGNADLWISFRKLGSKLWSTPKNFRLFQHVDSINTPANEYSPFIYCVDGTPHLLFSSNRSGSYDIYDATIIVDAANESITVTSVQAMPGGREGINSEAREMFPFVPFPHEEAKEQLFIFSSDKFSVRDPSNAKRAGAGGLDLYRTRTRMLCDYPDSTPPKPAVPKGSIRYVVALIDGMSGKPIDLRPHISVVINETDTIATDSHAVDITISADDTLRMRDVVRIKTVGGSAYRRKPCTEKDPIVVAYARRMISDRIQKLHPRRRAVQYDTIIQEPAIQLRKSTIVYDTLKQGEKFNPSQRDLEVSVSNDGRLMVGRKTTITIDSLPPLKTLTKMRTEYYTDTTFHYDTTFLHLSGNDIASDRTQAAPISVRRPYRDTVIVDTIRIYPVFETAAPCMQIFATSDSVRNVPYFQTGFWEVNTSVGFERHLDRLRNGDLEDASWIELNWRNKYFGSRISNEVSERLTRRRGEYRKKAQIIDDNITNLVDRTSSMLQRFWRDHAEDPAAKVIISMMAYSDVRPIMAGRYIADTSVRYIAASYDSVAQSFGMPLSVSIAPGASLVGSDNDTLSKLRAYFGYTSVMEQLEKDSLYRVLRGRGLVVLPTDVDTPQQYLERVRNARIIVLAEGRKVDMSVKPSRQAYIGEDDDYYDLDAVRRVDVHVRRIDLRAPSWIVPECCR